MLKDGLIFWGEVDPELNKWAVADLMDEWLN